MSKLDGKVGELKFTIEITRKETGKVETIELVGNVTESGEHNGGDTLDSGEKCGD